MKYILFFIALFVLFFFYDDKEDSSSLQAPSHSLETISQTSSEFPREQRTPGGIVKLHFKNRPEFFLNNKKMDVFTKKNKTDWLVLLPLSLYKGLDTLRYTSETSSIFQVHLIAPQPDNYKTQYINVKNKEFVKASKKTLERIERDSALKHKNFAKFTRLYNQDLKMIKPLDSKLRHDFGRKRFFNGVAKNPHAGIDLSGKKGDKIKAPLAGTVILLGNLFYNGNMMLIDHGQGLITAYSHLSKYLKQDGDWVKQGEYIGEVGATGRVTGPHLHWSVYLGGEPVNPDLFLEDAIL